MADAAKPNWFAKHKVLTVLLVLIVFGAAVNMIGGSKETAPTSTAPSAAPTPAAPAPTEEAKKVTAAELYSAYKGNELAADAEYKGKMVQVSGEVSNIGKDILGTPYVAMKGTNDYETVQCMLKADASAEAAALKKGDQVTLEGEVSGYLLNVIVKDCVFVK